MKKMKPRLQELYFGDSASARRFRYWLLAFDLVTITFFIITSMFPETPPILAAEYAIAVFLIFDFSARLWLAKHKLKYLVEPLTIADLIVIGTLVLAAFIENWGFLRVIRLLRLLHSYQLLRDLRSKSPWFEDNEQIIKSSLNIVVFIFFVTALVYVLEVDAEAQINNYIDALYFTVTALTTTGFGDVTLQGTHGRLLAVVIMVVGVALFLRLIQTIFRREKVHHTCPGCGLDRHEHDAEYCKKCGIAIHIAPESK